MTCPQCRKDAKPLYQVGNRFICFDCVPADAWAEYPGNYERALARQQKADRARANFSHAKEARVGA